MYVLIPVLSPGVVDYLQTEISTSKQKKFPLVTFLDTPGLVDGDMNYPFDVNEAITWLAELSDLIFVVFDPIGQVWVSPRSMVNFSHRCSLFLLFRLFARELSILWRP